MTGELSEVPRPTSTLRHRYGVIEEVAPGIFWIRLPLPFRPGYVNAWALSDGDSWTLIDAGAMSPHSCDIWQDVSRSLLGTRPVSRLIVTHEHPDHLGAAGWLQEQFGAALWMSEAEWLLGRLQQQDSQSRSQAQIRQFFINCDVSVAHLDELGKGDGAYRYFSEIPRSYRRLEHNATIQIGSDRWRLIFGRGHSPAHVCLYCADRRILISGDHILARIVPTVRVFPNEPMDDPVGDYLASLDRFADLHSDTLILPAHGRPYSGIHGRIEGLRKHYAEGLEALLRRCTDSMTVMNCIVEDDGPKADISRIRLVVAETLAQLNALAARGRLSRRALGDKWIFTRIDADTTPT